MGGGPDGSSLSLSKTHFLQGYAIVAGSFVKIFKHLLCAGHFQFCGFMKNSQPGLTIDTASTDHRSSERDLSLKTLLGS